MRLTVKSALAVSLIALSTAGVIGCGDAGQPTQNAQTPAPSAGAGAGAVVVTETCRECNHDHLRELITPHGGYRELPDNAFASVGTGRAHGRDPGGPPRLRRLIPLTAAVAAGGDQLQSAVTGERCLLTLRAATVWSRFVVLTGRIRGWTRCIGTSSWSRRSTTGPRRPRW